MKTIKTITMIIFASLTLALIATATIIVPIVKQNKAIEQERLEQLEREIKFENCMETAFLDYIQSWNSQCKATGQKDNCNLPERKANVVNEWLENDEKNCVQMYK